MHNGTFLGPYLADTNGDITSKNWDTPCPNKHPNLKGCSVLGHRPETGERCEMGGAFASKVDASFAFRLAFGFEPNGTDGSGHLAFSWDKHSYNYIWGRPPQN